MFWLDRLIRFWQPIPPTPTPAMFNKSLGGGKPRPRTCLGTKAAAALPAATSLRNLRRVTSFFPVPPWLAVSALPFFFSSLGLSLITLLLHPRSRRHYLSTQQGWRHSSCVQWHGRHLEGTGGWLHGTPRTR